MSLETYKFKQWDTTTHLLEWQKFKTLTPNAGEYVEQQEFSLLTGMQHGIATLDSLAISYKTKHTLAIQSSSGAPCYLCK